MDAGVAVADIHYLHRPRRCLMKLASSRCHAKWQHQSRRPSSGLQLFAEARTNARRSLWMFGEIPQNVSRCSDRCAAWYQLGHNAHGRQETSFGGRSTLLQSRRQTTTARPEPGRRNASGPESGYCDGVAIAFGP